MADGDFVLDLIILDVIQIQVFTSKFIRKDERGRMKRWKRRRRKKKIKRKKRRGVSSGDSKQWGRTPCGNVDKEKVKGEADSDREGQTQSQTKKDSSRDR